MSDIQRTEVITEASPEGCSIEKFNIKSPSMQREIKAIAVLPPAYGREPQKAFPVLYTLHGAGAPYDTWAQMSKLRSFIKEKPFIYTCFDGDNRSLYIDAPYPLVVSRKPEEEPDKLPSLFTTFFFKEFVPAMDAWYRIDTGNRAATGFSMGGWGAFHYMLCKPGMFRSVSGLSSAFFYVADGDQRRKELMEAVLGSRDKHPERHRVLDPFQRLEELLGKGGTVPPIYQACGTGDFLIPHNRKMDTFAKEKELDFTYVETEGGHDWKFWHPASVGVAEFHWKHFNRP